MVHNFYCNVMPLHASAEGLYFSKLCSRLVSLVMRYKYSLSIFKKNCIIYISHFLFLKWNILVLTDKPAFYLEKKERQFFYNMKG